MVTNIFVNITVKDLQKSKDFFARLGFGFNAQFEDETAACLILGPNSYAMLLTENKMKEFTTKQIADTATTTECINSLSVDSREEVDTFMEKVLAAGGREPRDPQVYDFMYGRGFEDIDGHLWEVFWMDPDYIE